MDELEQIRADLDKLVQAVDYVIKEQDRLDKMYEEGHAADDERFHKIESTLTDEILGPAQEAYNKYDYDKRFGEFHDKYGSQLDEFNDKFRAIPGNEDYDMSKEAFDKYNSMEGDKPNEDAYVAELVKQAGETLDAIKKAMGVDSNAVVEVEKKGDEPEIQRTSVANGDATAVSDVNVTASPFIDVTVNVAFTVDVVTLDLRESWEPTSILMTAEAGRVIVNAVLATIAVVYPVTQSSP